MLRFRESFMMIVFVLSTFVLSIHFVAAGPDDFSIAPTLHWPPVDHTDGDYGALSNPTGNPIGGFVGYSRIVDPSSADYYVYNVEQLQNALGSITPGQIIYIDDNAILDFTNRPALVINVSNITIASGRGNGNSLGALLVQDVRRYNGTITWRAPAIMKINAEHVRITGMRFYGGDEGCYDEINRAFSEKPDLAGQFYHMVQVTDGLQVLNSYAEVDNDEFSGFREAAIATQQSDALNTFVHHSYIHNNCLQGLGYGVSLGENTAVSFLIEANLFNSNRHSIASTNMPNSYEARYNIQLPNALWHSFDRHGAPGGNYTVVHHNSIYVADKPSSEVQGSGCDSGRGDTIGIRAPPVSTDGGQVYNNYIACPYGAFSGGIFTRYENGTESDPPGAPGTNVSVHDNDIAFDLVYDDVQAIADKRTVFVDEPVTFHAGYQGVPRYIGWNFADGSSGASGATVTHAFAHPGRYLVKATASDSVGLIGDGYTSVTVVPRDSSAYLNFWVYENSMVSSSNYVQKQAKVNDVLVWADDIAPGKNGWTYVSVKVPENVLDAGMLNISIGVKTMSDFTEIPYPAPHPAAFWQVDFDQVSLILEGQDHIGSYGDFEKYSWLWSSQKDDPTWTSGYSWEHPMNGDYDYRIVPEYRGSYHAGNFDGLSIMVPISRAVIAHSNIMAKNVTTTGNVTHLSIADPHLQLYMPFNIPPVRELAMDFTSGLSHGKIFGAHWNGKGYVFDGTDRSYLQQTGDYGPIREETLCAVVSKNPGFYNGDIFGGIYGTSLLVTSKDYFGLSGNSNNSLGTCYDYLVSGPIISSKTYHLCGVLRHDGTRELYIDGILNTTDVQPNPVFVGGYMDISAGPYYYSGYEFNGTVYSVMRFDRALDASEIAVLYNNESHEYYTNGEIIFSGVNLTGHSYLNISLGGCSTPSGTSIRARVGNNSWRDFINCSIDNYALNGIAGDAEVSLALVSDGVNTPIVFGSMDLLGASGCSPVDVNCDGCISLGEISGYVSQWLSGHVSIGDVSSAVAEWLGGC